MGRIAAGFGNEKAQANLETVANFASDSLPSPWYPGERGRG